MADPRSILLTGPSSVSMAQVRAWASRRHAANPEGLHDYLRETWRLCAEYRPMPNSPARAKLNHGVLAAQSDLETGSWTSADWRIRDNPAGIAHDDDKDAGADFLDPVDGARAQVVHMSAYVFGRLHQADPLAVYIPRDPVYQRVFDKGYAGTVRTLADLGDGKWATDPDYAEKIAERLEGIERMPTEVPPPQVPKDVRDLLPPLRWVNGCANFHPRPRGMKPVAIAWHITDDLVLDHTVSWFLNRSSRASAHFVITREVDPRTGMAVVLQFVSSTNAAWTNGVYRRWRTDIPWLVDAIAACQRREHNLNDFTVNVETIGTPDDPPTEPQIKSQIALGRYFCDPRVYGISPHRGHQLRHADIDGVERSYCPGPRFDLRRIILALGGDPAGMRG